MLKTLASTFLHVILLICEAEHSQFSDQPSILYLHNYGQLFTENPLVYCLNLLLKYSAKKKMYRVY